MRMFMKMIRYVSFVIMCLLGIRNVEAMEGFKTSAEVLMKVTFLKSQAAKITTKQVKKPSPKLKTKFKEKIRKSRESVEKYLETITEEERLSLKNSVIFGGENDGKKAVQFAIDESSEAVVKYLIEQDFIFDEATIDAAREKDEKEGTTWLTTLYSAVNIRNLKRIENMLSDDKIDQIKSELQTDEDAAIFREALDIDEEKESVSKIIKFVQDHWDVWGGDIQARLKKIVNITPPITAAAEPAPATEEAEEDTDEEDDEVEEPAPSVDIAPLQKALSAAVEVMVKLHGVLQELGKKTAEPKVEMPKNEPKPDEGKDSSAAIKHPFQKPKPPKAPKAKTAFNPKKTVFDDAPKVETSEYDTGYKQGLIDGAKAVSGLDSQEPDIKDIDGKSVDYNTGYKAGLKLGFAEEKERKKASAKEKATQVLTEEDKKKQDTGAHLTPEAIAALKLKFKKIQQKKAQVKKPTLKKALNPTDG